MAQRKATGLGNDQHAIPPHPNQLQPLGNQWLCGASDGGGGGANSVRTQGLGSLAALSDEMVIRVLEWLGPHELCNLSCASKALAVFCAYEDLWRALVLTKCEGNFRFQHTWKHTFLKHHNPKAALCKPVSVAGLFSDVLFQPFLCSRTPLHPAWVGDGRGVRAVPRVAGLSLQEFRERFEIPNKPVIFTDVVGQWKGFGDCSHEWWLHQCAGQTFSVGHFQMSLPDYFHYARCAVDDQPMYLFDPDFAHKVPALDAAYTPPAYFDDDLFRLLHKSRPNYRWLIIGPARSGSTFHVDPNCTSAWNGVIKGKKKWVMYPPHEIPPGVHPSSDGSSVATPVSLVEWFISFYDHNHDDRNSERVECVLNEGELLFVPRGWWHCALNLEDTFAITQNFATPITLPHVLRFLRNKPDQVSGVPEERKATLGAELEAALREHRPELLDQLEERERKRQRTGALFAGGGGGGGGGGQAGQSFAFGF